MLAWDRPQLGMDEVVICFK